MSQSFLGCPDIIREFLFYLLTIRNLSARTVDAYWVDLRSFFRYMKLRRGLVPADTELGSISIEDVTLEFVSSVTTMDIYEYLHFVMSQRENNANTRSRKISALRSYFKYLTVKTNKLDKDPVKNLEVPSLKKSLPKYLTLEESIDLLSAVDGDFAARDYCILTLFLNCGMRLSELVGINISDIHEETITITGKGNYKGAKGTQTFNITGQDIGLLNVASKDVNFVNKKNKYKSAPVVTDVNGKKVSAKEYTVTYSYENGLPVGTNDIPKSGTVIRVTVTGKGTNYTGSKTTEYRVIDKTNNISDTKAYKAAVQGIFVYTGSPIHPGTEVIDLTDKAGNRLHDFEIVSYGTNIKKGTGTVVIRGTGELGGTRTVKFTILVQPITDIENISK